MRAQGTLSSNQKMSQSHCEFCFMVREKIFKVFLSDYNPRLMPAMFIILLDTELFDVTTYHKYICPHEKTSPI